MTLLDDPRTRIAWVLTFLFFIIAVSQSLTQGFNALNYDEDAHLSYIASLQNPEAGWWPRLETLKMLDKTSFAFTNRANYLNHPPVFYKLLGAIGPHVENNPSSFYVYRLFNAFMTSVGLLLFLSAGKMFLRPREFYAYAAMVTFIPTLLATASLVTNDGLAFLGGGLAFFGTGAAVARGNPKWLWAAFVGFIIAGLAKLTAFMLVGLFLGFTLLFLLFWKTLRPSWGLLFLAAAATAVLPYVYFIAIYGTPVPQTPGQYEFLSQWHVGERLGPINYLNAFYTSLLVTFSTAQPNDWITFILQNIVLGLCAIGIADAVLSIKKHSTHDMNVLVLAAVLALAVTLCAHFTFGYLTHHRDGYVIVAMARFYLPLMAAVPLACISLSRRLPLKPQRALLTLLTLLPFVTIGMLALQPSN